MYSLMPNVIKSYVRKVAILIVAIAITIFAWANMYYNLDANAATLDGVSDQIEGKVTKDIGTKRRAVGDLLDNPSEEAKGVFTQAQGKAKQDLGTAKNKLDEAGDQIENTSEGLLDSVKDFFD